MNALKTALATQPWAMMPEIINALMAGTPAPEAANAARAARAGASAPGSIAVIPLAGVIVPHASGWFGDEAALDVFGAALDAAVADPGIAAILIDIDSPGGSVYGVGEAAAQVYAARSAKPVVAIANSLAASAAYWIGSQAAEFHVTPSGEAGSIGVWQAHMDVSQAMEEAGVKATLISAGKFKTEGNPFEPLSEEARGFMQSRVDDYYAAFTRAVARGRNIGVEQVRSGMGQGRVLGADAALAENMVDGIATRDEVLRRMARAVRPGNARGSMKVENARRALALLG